MTKIFVPLPKNEFIDLYIKDNIDGFFLGIDEFSMNFNRYVKIDELKSIVEKLKNNNIKSYICLNKLYYENDINGLKKLLFEIEKIEVDAVLFSDIAVYNIVNENNLKINLISNLSHLLTNYKTIEFWKKRNVSGAILSTEITIDEVINIKKKTNFCIGITLYGFLNMMTSSRTLISNYFKYINKETSNNDYKMALNEEKYPIIEENDITNIFSSKVLNGITFFKDLIINKIDFVYLDDYLLSNSDFINIIKAFDSLRNNYLDDKIIEKMDKVIKENTKYETSTYFLDKKTIFKVKKNEKN